MNETHRKKIYERDTMTAEERLRTVIDVRIPDRVPVSPLFYYFAANYAGITYADLYQPKCFNMAMDTVFRDLGPWDAFYTLHFYDREVKTFAFPMKVKEPGFELPPDAIQQYLEDEVMRVEDYEWVINAGRHLPWITLVRFFTERLIPRIWDQVDEGWKSYAYMMPRMSRHILHWKMEFNRWQKQRGLAILYGMGFELAFDNFSMARGLLNFARDFKSHGDEIVKAADAMTDSYVFLLRVFCKLMGIDRVMLALHRSSNDFISPAQFERFSLPSARMVVEKLADAGISSVLHCDGNWDLNLEALRTLPARKVVMQCDGATDIFKAKEILGDHCCIYGDVPANMLTLGSPTEVDEYCHRLIEEVGKGGGFILGAGCEVAPTAKPENVKAMLDSVRKYGYYA